MALSPYRGPFSIPGQLCKRSRATVRTTNRCSVNPPPYRLHHTVTVPSAPPTGPPRRTPKITSISPSITPTRRGPIGRLHMPGSGWARHELYLDFRSREPQSTFYSDGKWVDDPPCPPVNPYFLSTVRKTVAQSPDIDAVHLHSFNQHLTEEVWRALSGVQPSHLEMTPGFDESCNYAGLADVTPPWPLKSLYLAAYEGDGNSEHEGSPDPQYSVSFPACYANLETLVLHFPGAYDMYFYPEGGARKLRSFTASQNDVVAVFAKTVACNPALVHTLRSVTLNIPDGRDAPARHVDRMLEFFRQSALERLELVLNDRYPYKSDPLSGDNDDPVNDGQLEQEIGGDAGAEVNVPGEFVADRRRCKQPYLDLSDNLPETLASLSFCGPANVSMLEGLDKWITCANNTAWLPNLQTIAFRVDLKNNLGNGEELSQEQKAVLGQKVERLLGILTGRSPSVRVVEPRDPNELVYPLPV